MIGAVVAAMVFISAAVVCCIGAWVIFGPVNYVGCGTGRPDGITASDLVGTYVTADGGRLELRADGTFDASGLADHDVDGEPAPRRLSGPGTWGLRPADSVEQDIYLSFTAPAGHQEGFGVSIAGTREEPWLYWYVGDPDSCDLYGFERV
jgi:hypothetical protein